jgi:hypothetical protein
VWVRFEELKFGVRVKQRVSIIQACDVALD